MAEEEIKKEEQVVSEEKVEAPEKVTGEEKKVETTKEEVKEEKKVEVKEGKAKKIEKKDSKVELEREYVVPLRSGFLNVPRYRRAKKAVRVLKEFIARHMKVYDRDLNKVKIDRYLNNEIWFRGIKKPANKIKVLAKKVDGVVTVYLAEPSDHVKFLMAKEEKRNAVSIQKKPVKKAVKEEKKDKDGDGVDDKVEEKEDKKANEEKVAGIEKAAVKEMKHTAAGAHMKKTMPVRKALKK